MQRTSLAAAALSLLLSNAPAGAQVAVDPDPVFAQWNSPASPGCAAAIARDGKTVLERGYGSADLEHDVPITPATIFEAGSVSKQFTAAAILKLAEEAKLRLGDDVRKYVPELPDYGAVITVDHLLSHTSGLRDWGSVMDIAGWPRTTRAYTPSDVLDVIVRQKSLNYRPGAEYSYTNSGYNLMALIVERLSGSGLAAFTAERFFKPLGMASTSWRDDFRRIVKGRAVAYSKGEDGYRQDMPFEDAYGNGGLLTTTGDLLRWNEGLTTGALGPFVTAELQRRARLSDGTPITYARGLFIERYRGGDEVSHGGATAGYRAWLGRWPTRGLSLALLCNAAEANGSQIAHQLIDGFIGMDAPAPAQVPATAEGRAGTFVNARTGMPARISEEGGQLKLGSSITLGSLGPNRLGFRGGELLFSSPDAFVLKTGDGQSVDYRRVLPWDPTASDLAAVTGIYRSDEAGAAYTAAVEDGKLFLRLDRRPHVSVPLKPVYRNVFEADSGIVRIERGRDGKVAALRFGTSRVRDIRFARTLQP